MRKIQKFGVKVHIFWEGHKILQNLHQLFVAISEYMNFRNQSFQKNYYSWSPNSPSQYSSQKKTSERVGWLLMPKNDFKSTNFVNFE